MYHPHFTVPGGLCLGGVSLTETPWREIPWIETPKTETPWTETPLDRDPPDRDAPKQRPSRQRPLPMDRDPAGQRHPWTETLLDRDPSWTETHWTETPWSCDLWCMLGQRPPREQNNWQTGVKTLPCRNFVAGGNKTLVVHEQTSAYGISFDYLRWHLTHA